jgi:hypothetical protein
MKTPSNRFFAMLIILPSLSISPLCAQYAITSHTIDGGGGISSSGAFALQGTIGQPDASSASGGPFSLVGGFWGGPSKSLSGGYSDWAAINIAPGLDDSFGGDANNDGLANGLVYIFGEAGVQLFGAGVLTAPPPVVPIDVKLTLETSTSLQHWTRILVYEAGVQTLVVQGLTIDAGILTYPGTGPNRFYRYRAELLP